MASQIAVTDQPNWKPFKMPKEKKRYALPKESAKRAAERVEYSQKRKDYLWSHTCCEFDDCGNRASEIHHKARRGAHYLDESTFFATCRYHHRWIHDNPREAREAGLLA